MSALVKIGGCCGCGGSGFTPTTCLNDDDGLVYNLPKFVRWTVVSNYSALNGLTGVTQLPAEEVPGQPCVCVDPILLEWNVSKAVVLSPSVVAYGQMCRLNQLYVCLPCPLSSNFPNAQGIDPDPPTAPDLDYFRVTATAAGIGGSCAHVVPVSWPPHDTDFPGGSSTASGVCCYLYLGHWKINGFGAGFTAHSPIYSVVPNHFTDFGNDIWEYIPCEACVPSWPGAGDFCTPVPEFDPADPSYTGDVQFQIFLEAA